MTTYKENNNLNKIFISMMGLGILGIAGAFYFLPIKVWVNILTVNFMFLSIGLFGIFMLAVTNIVGAAFVAPYRKILEALAGTVPYLGLSMFVILLGAHSLYEWTHADVVMNDKILMSKAAYLNLPFFSVRMIICIGLWSLMSMVLIKKFKEQEDFPDKAEDIQKSLSGLSALFMIVFGVTYSVASFDWIMSLEPHWFSTIFGVYTFSGLVVSGLATLILVLIYLQSQGYMEEVNLNHYHDLGKLLLGFTTFWAYIWFSQYLLIWYANIPEESEYYVLREHYGWNLLFWANIILSWAIPFMILLPRWTKRNKKVLQWTCYIILVGQWLNLYVMVAPKVMEHHGVTNVSITWVELFIAAGYAGFFLFVFFKKLSKSSLVAENSPFLAEGLALEQ